jgi:hypothetical protein
MSEGCTVMNSSNRTAMHSGVIDYVFGFERAGLVVDVAVAARELIALYPDSGLTFDEVAAMIMDTAIKRRAVVYSSGEERQEPGFGQVPVPPSA